MDSNEVGLGAMASVLSCVELRLRNTVDAFEVLIVVDLSRWETVASTCTAISFLSCHSYYGLID